MSSVRTADESIRTAFDPAAAEGRAQVEPRLEIALPATRDNLALIRETAERFLASELERRNLRALLPETLLALQEASSNVVRHAYRDQSEPGPIVVRAEVLPRLLRLTVLDEGPGYDPSDVPAPDFARPRDGGYGLHLMRTTMSKVSYARRGGRNVLLMEKALFAEGSGTPA